MTKKTGNRRLRWLVLLLVIALLLILLPLGIFIVQPKPAAASNGKIKIMPLGDSITYGVHSSTGAGYRLPLWTALKTQGARVDFVGSMHSGPNNFDADNEGLPGWKIRQIAANVVGWLKDYKPQIILLHIGTNDFIKNDDPAHAPARLESLVDQITSTLPEATLIVAQIIPLPLNSKLNEEVVTYNRAIPGIVQAEIARGRHVQYVDMYHAVAPGLLPDHIHPNDLGYDLMAKVWEKALAPLLKLNYKSESSLQNLDQHRPQPGPAILADNSRRSLARSATAAFLGRKPLHCA